MIRLTGLRAPLEGAAEEYKGLAASVLRIKPELVRACRLVRRSIDARRKEDIHLVLTLDVEVFGDEEAILRRSGAAEAKIAPVRKAHVERPLASPPVPRPVVVGSGPAGLFAALVLARAGARPLLIERGRDVLTRQRDVQAFFAGGALDPESNVQFGEGGAGTFSDGKLSTGIKDPRCAHVLEAFVACGAPEEILWQAKPHVGTDRLVDVVRGIRGWIEALGGEVRFGARLTDVHVEQGALRGIAINGETIEARALALCIGHSARDTMRMLAAAGLPMARKPFSIGARIEHPQAWLDKAQYGALAGHPALGAADYKLSARLPDGRGVYTFCMCPGGVVVAAASEAGAVVTNGMSNFAREGKNANSALLVDVRPEDLPGDDPLEGLRFQQKWERLAFEAGGGDYRAPAQRVGDFLLKRTPGTLSGIVEPSYRPGVTPADLRACLPAFVTDAMAEGISLLNRKLRGFAHLEALLTGVETRSSSPVRIARDEAGQAGIRGIFPAGEGAGYAGGILSAAVDGMRAAEHILETYQQTEDFA